VPLAAVGRAVTEQPLYQGSAEVLLSQLDLGASLTGIQTSAAACSRSRVAQTQASLARVPTVAQMTLSNLHLHDRSVGDFLKNSNVTAQTNSDLLEFTVTDPDPKLASRLAVPVEQEAV
jgi:capsular polysaccharide biosynthesis protein